MTFAWNYYYIYKLLLFIIYYYLFIYINYYIYYIYKDKSKRRKCKKFFVLGKEKNNKIIISYKYTYIIISNHLSKSMSKSFILIKKNRLKHWKYYFFIVYYSLFISIVY